jgi:hypothetical protein
LRVQTQPRSMDFKGDKIRSTPSFGGEVKPSVPCCRFTACKRTLLARQVLVGKIQQPCFSPAFHLLRHKVVSAGFANRCPWWSYQVARTRLIVGLITPYCIYLTIMKPVREAKARSRAMLCMYIFCRPFQNQSPPFQRGQYCRERGQKPSPHTCICAYVKKSCAQIIRTWIIGSLVYLMFTFLDSRWENDTFQI